MNKKEFFISKPEQTDRQNVCSYGSLHQKRHLMNSLQVSNSVEKKVDKGHHTSFSVAVGYSMDHIRLSWHAGDKSVAIEAGVSLPQFRVLGFNRRTIIASTSTGKNTWPSHPYNSALFFCVFEKFINLKFLGKEKLLFVTKFKCQIILSSFCSTQKYIEEAIKIYPEK